MNFSIFSQPARALGCAMALGMAAQAMAADWPSYRGPLHNGSSPEKLSPWGPKGLRQAWKSPTPNGFSSFAVAEGRAVTQISREEEGVEHEFCLALDAATGRELWATRLGVAKYGHNGGNAGAAGNSGGDGPRSTPTLDGGKAYILSSDLVLFCLDAATGKAVWQKDLIKEHNGRNITWKNAASPVIEGNFVFVAGGGPGESLLAVEKNTGKVAWKTGTETITHSTPVLATLHGVRQVIFFVQSGLVSVESSTGKELWKFGFPFRTSTAMTPIVAGDIVFCSAGYGVGAGACRVSKSGDSFKAEELWRKPNQLPNHWSTPVEKDGYLYGMFSFKEYGTGPLKCVELATGREVWARDGFGAGNVILVDGKILALSDAGELVLAEANPGAYKELARSKVLEGKCWSTPVLSDGKIYARSTREGVCLEAAAQVSQK